MDLSSLQDRKCEIGSHKKEWDWIRKLRADSRCESQCNDLSMQPPPKGSKPLLLLVQSNLPCATMAVTALEPWNCSQATTRCSAMSSKMSSVLTFRLHCLSFPLCSDLHIYSKSCNKWQCYSGPVSLCYPVGSIPLYLAHFIPNAEIENVPNSFKTLCIKWKLTCKFMSSFCF